MLGVHDKKVLAPKLCLIQESSDNNGFFGSSVFSLVYLHFCVCAFYYWEQNVMKKAGMKFTRLGELCYHREHKDLCYAWISSAGLFCRVIY